MDDAGDEEKNEKYIMWSLRMATNTAPTSQAIRA
jgi:hypothetical protein